MAHSPFTPDNHESRIDTIFEHAFQFVGLLSTEGILLEANPSALRHASVSADAVVGKPFWQTPWWAHSAEEQERLKSAISQASDGTFVRFETTHRARDGTLDPIDFSLTPIHDASGQVIYLLPEGRPINPLKEALTNAAESEQRFRKLAALLPETVYEMDASGRFAYVNEKALEQFGYSQADFEAGANAFDMIIAGDHQRAVENIVRALAGERVYHNEYTCLRKDGSTFPALFYSTVKYRDGKPDGVLGLIIDNTHQKKLEKELRERETRYRIATEAGLTGVWDHDLSTGEMVIDANLKNLLGYDKDEITRWDAWKPLFHPDDVARFMQHSRRYIKGLIPRYEVRGRVLDKLGKVRWILIRGVAERDACGWVRRMIGSATDITRLHEAEMALEKARDNLEARVNARTRELRDANKTLRAVVREKIQTARVLKQREAELELKSGKLEDLNTALRFLLKKMDREKTAIEEKMMADLRDLVQPYLKKLIRKSRDREIRALATILDNHLRAIVSTFSRHLTSPSINLTPAEINVAHLVKDGHSTRQIAATLNVAYKTVETHRVNIRKKLGMTRKGGNMRTCLMAMDKPLR
jgi:PAS domain S-box-containing protein